MRSERALLLALVATLSAAIGAPCGAGPNHSLSFEAPATVPTGTVFSVDVVVNAANPIHAFDFDVKWESAPLAWAFLVEPHVEFDDDSALFLTPAISTNQGTVKGVVDLRHGGPGLSGTFRVARIWFFSFFAPAPLHLSFTSGNLATAGGASPVVALKPSVVTIGP